MHVYHMSCMCIVCHAYVPYSWEKHLLDVANYLNPARYLHRLFGISEDIGCPIPEVANNIRTQTV